MHFSKICRVMPQPVVLLFLVFSRIGSNGLIYEFLQRFRLILLRNSAHDGIPDDIAVPIYYIGSGIGINAGGKSSRLAVRVKIHILIRSAFLGQYVLRKFLPHSHPA